MDARKQPPRRPPQLAALRKLADALIGKPNGANDHLPTREEMEHMHKSDMRETLPVTPTRIK
ncbi:hypothetical protein SAMN02787142_2101 [Burkholderia sp. WP9]|uniref:hypothetical protein n=1 Tax=Burkholderia sp. WP9 TaxID=1500263 RepID=UPI00089BA129|nr:hypothetical protein [Burkholderia sp. WP9]SEC87080.1 hypothetical protein SAMN02787142_2101 [Burkholderia sp. WP9]